MSNTLIFYYEDKPGVQTGYLGYRCGENCMLRLEGITAPSNQTMIIESIDLTTNVKESFVITHNDYYIFLDNVTYILKKLTDSDGKVYLENVHLRPEREANPHSSIYGICGDKCRVPVLNDTSWQDAIVNTSSTLIKSITLKYRVIDSTLIVRGDVVLNYTPKTDLLTNVPIGSIPEEIALRLTRGTTRVIENKLAYSMSQSTGTKVTYLMSANLGLNESGGMNIVLMTHEANTEYSQTITFNFEEHYALD